MAVLRSELVASLIDRISGPAAKAGRSLDGLARKGNRRGGFLGKMAADMKNEGMSALGLGGGVAGLAAGLAIAHKSFAANDREMTRIGITAEATKEEIAAAGQVIRKTASDTGLAVDDLRTGVETLVAAGMSLPEAMGSLPAVARTAQASGAAVDDVSATAVAMAQNLKVPVNDMLLSFDYLAKAGKLGSFELKDMARSFPSLAAQASTLGYKGSEGVLRLAAALQVVRKQTGTSGEAATNFSNVMAKIYSTETANKFKKLRMPNFAKDMKAGIASGRDFVEVLSELVLKATKGDLSQLPKLFEDAQAQAGVRALVQGSKALAEYKKQLQSAGGTVNTDLAKVANDAESAWTRGYNAVTNFGRAVGGLAESGAGASSWIADTTRALEGMNSTLDGISARIKNRGFLGAIGEQISEDTKKVENDPAASAPLTLGTWQSKQREIEARRKSLEDEEDYLRIRARREQAERRYRGGVAAGTATDRSREIYQREMATADAAEADVRRRHLQEQAEVSRLLAERAAKKFAYDRPDFREGRVKDDTYVYKPAFGPAMPPRSALPPRAAIAPVTGAPMPPARPPEIAPKVDASSIDAAATKAQELQGQLAATNGQTVTATVSLKNADASLATLRAISAEITKINGSVLKQFGAGGGGNGSFSDTGVGG